MDIESVFKYILIILPFYEKIQRELGTLIELKFWD